MIRKEIHPIVLELTTGNIINQPDMDVIVNAANARLRTGGGVAGAIHSIGDPELTQETRPMAPISPGEAVITSAPNLPNKHIIHCLGPVYGRDKPEEKILANCYKHALELANEHQLTSIAFPSISTGAFGYPMKEAAAIAFQTIQKAAPELDYVKIVRIVLFSETDYKLHLDVLDKVLSD